MRKLEYFKLNYLIMKLILSFVYQNKNILEGTSQNNFEKAREALRMTVYRI